MSAVVGRLYNDGGSWEKTGQKNVNVSNVREKFGQPKRKLYFSKLYCLFPWKNSRDYIVLELLHIWSMALFIYHTVQMILY